MKKLFFLMLTATLIGCGGSKTIRSSKKVIKGNWTLHSVSHNQTGTYDINLLNDASKGCFEGSSWQFIPNNNTGIYTINNSSCSTGERHFIFTIDEIDEVTGLYDFLLKPTDQKRKSATNKGFRLRLKELSETTMQWQQTVNLDGKPFTINMNFSKL